jgi:hypothetical protein
MTQLNIDSIIDRLLTVRGSSKPGKTVTLDEKDIIALLKVARQVFLSQPMLLELAAPVKICGNTHHLYQATFTVSITTYCAYSASVANHLVPTTCSSVITLIVESKASKPSA